MAIVSFQITDPDKLKIQRIGAHLGTTNRSIILRYCICCGERWIDQVETGMRKVANYAIGNGNSPSGGIVITSGVVSCSVEVTQASTERRILVSK